jgi:hypothetical protein
LGFGTIPTVWWFVFAFHFISYSTLVYFKNIPKTIWCTLPEMIQVFHYEPRLQNVRSYSPTNCKVEILSVTMLFSRFLFRRMPCI